MVKMGTVWDRAAEFLTDNLAAIVPVALLAFFVPFSISGSFEHVSPGASFQLALVIELVKLAFGVLAIWGSLTLTAMVFGDDGRVAGKLASRRLVPALVVSVVMLLGCALLFAPVFAVLWSAGVDFFAMDTSGPPAISAAQGGIILVNVLIALPVMLWLAARLTLVNPVIVGEKRMLGSLARSWHLTRGMTLKIVGVLILYVVVSFVAALATKTVFGSIFQLIAGPASGLSLSAVLTSVMVAAVQTGIAVIAPLFIANLYIALTGRGSATPA